MEDLVNILLVEDDEVDVMNVKRAFKKNNITNPLHVAGNGIEALDILKNIDGETRVSGPTIVLLDINMPRMGGIEFLQTIRNDEVLKSLVVIIMTTSNDEKDKVEAYNLNVAGYIVKPLSFEHFSEVVVKLKNYWQICELPSLVTR